MSIPEQYIELLWGYFLFDMAVFSEPWLYIPLFIPFCFYLLFFVFKWCILSAPVWLPITIILNSVKALLNQYIKYLLFKAGYTNNDSNC